MSNWRDHIQVIVIGSPAEDEAKIRESIEAKIEEGLAKMGADE